MDIRVSVQAAPRDRTSWLDLARAVEVGGFHALHAADHPGSSPAPFVALSAAAAVTERIELGTCVVNAGVWEPLALASTVATLDLVSDGRAVLGVGAGHTPQEWTSTGRSFPAAGDRVSRMIELVEATSRLLAGGTTSYAGEHFTLADAVLDGPRPVRDPIPLLVGGNGRRVLRFAARNADIVGITGLGRMLADGHRHEVDWSPAALQETIRMISAATGLGRPPEMEALVQAVIVTEDTSASARDLTEYIPGASIDDLLSAPFVWIGTVDEIAAKLRRTQETLGISRYVVRPPAMTDARLSSTHSAADERQGAVRSCPASAARGEVSGCHRIASRKASTCVRQSRMGASSGPPPAPIGRTSKSAGSVGSPFQSIRRHQRKPALSATRLDAWFSGAIMHNISPSS
jgi:probable F420-dependent oxidoreductase